MSNRKYIMAELIRKAIEIDGRKASWLQITVAKFRMRSWSTQELLLTLVKTNELVHFIKCYNWYVQQNIDDMAADLEW